jgi:hypothetical protein
VEDFLRNIIKKERRFTQRIRGVIGECLNLTKQSKIILLVVAVMTLVFYIGFGWGNRTIKLASHEPKTTEKTTSTKELYTQKVFKKTIHKYQNMTTVTTDLERDAIMPGIKATRTLNFESGKVEMCTTMTPQGVAIAEEYLLTTAYDHDAQHNSVLYVQDKTSHALIKTVVLQGMPHVGGVTYDEDNQNIWVCSRRKGKAEIVAIPLKSLTQYDFNQTKKPIRYSQRVSLGTISRASFLTYENQALFIGFFNPSGRGNVQRYDMNKQGEIQAKEVIDGLNDRLDALTSSISTQDTLGKVQGIVFYKNYAILSQSYGPGTSKLYIFKKELTKKVFSAGDALAIIKTPAHLEQVSQNDSKLYLNFESSAYAYRQSSHNHVDRIVALDIEKLLHDFVEVKSNG